MGKLRKSLLNSRNEPTHKKTNRTTKKGMNEREKEIPLIVDFNNYFNPFYKTRFGRFIGRTFELTGIGQGEVEFNSVGIEGAEYAPGPPLRVVGTGAEAINLQFIPRLMAEFSVNIRYPDIPVFNTDFICRIMIDTMEFTAINLEKDTLPEKAEYAIFSKWGNQHLTPDFLIFTVDESLLQKVRIRFEK
jgi:hypothetical protein